MTKYFKTTSQDRSYPDLLERPDLIPKKLFLLSCVPSNPTSFKLLRKRCYICKKIELSTTSFPQKIHILRKSKKSHVTQLETYVREYFKYLDIWKHSKTFNSIELTVFSKYSNRIARKVWKTMYATSIKSLTIEYPYQAHPSALLKLLIFHRHIENLSYERLYSTFVLSAESPWKVNLKRYGELWERRFVESIRTLRLYMGFISTTYLEALVLQLKNLQILELESNNESEDDALINILPKLKKLSCLEKLSLTLSECSTQPLLLKILQELQALKLKDLTVLVPICRSSDSSKYNVHFPSLETLNLAISQSHSGHRSYMFQTDLYNFFSNFSFSNLKKFTIILEKYPSLKKNQISDELESFLGFLLTLQPTIKHLIVRFNGKSLEYFEWERVLEVIESLEHLESLELSEISFSNNFCIGLVAKVIDHLPKLKRLYIRPVTLSKTRFLETFVDKVVAHQSLQILHLMISSFSSIYVKPLLQKLKEFKLRTELNEDEGVICTNAFTKKNQNTVLGPLFFGYTRW